MNIDQINLYIDPGTGSMLFTILVGLISAGFFAIKKFYYKLKYKSNSKIKDEINAKKKDFVIFSDSKRYWNVFEPICDEFEKREKPLVYMTLSQDDPVFDKEYKFIKPEYLGEGNKGFAKLNMLNADIVLTTTPGLDVYQWKRSKDVKWYAHMLHALNDITGYRMFGTDYFDALLLSGQFQADQSRQLEKLRNLPEKEIKIVGLTYADEMLKKIEAAKKIDDNQTTVLLAPSWGASSILNKYGSKMIDALIDTGYNIIIRPHPQSMTSEKEMIDELMDKYPNKDNLQWNFDNDNFDVLNKSDILISDFSGILFDFSLVFDKPIIYADTSFDNGVYDAYCLDEEMWTFKTLPKIGKKLEEKDIASLKEVIDNCINSEENKDARQSVRNECWANIGNSAKLIADYLIDKQIELNKEQ